MIWIIGAAETLWAELVCGTRTTISDNNLDDRLWQLQPGWIISRNGVVCNALVAASSISISHLYHDLIKQTNKTESFTDNELSWRTRPPGHLWSNPQTRRQVHQDRWWRLNCGKELVDLRNSILRARHRVAHSALRLEDLVIVAALVSLIAEEVHLFEFVQILKVHVAQIIYTNQGAQE